jgi:hypothetical protein
MEPQVLLQISQEASTDPYAELDESSPHSNHILVSYILILYTHLRLGPPSLLFSRVFLPKTYTYSTIMRAMCPAILFGLF